MSTVLGPFTPTTPTVALECLAGSVNSPISLTALSADNWPSTFFCTNVGTAGSFLVIATPDYLANASPTVSAFLLPGETMIYQVDAPGQSQITGTALVAATYGFGATTITVTGGVNQ